MARGKVSWGADINNYFSLPAKTLHLAVSQLPLPLFPGPTCCNLLQQVALSHWSRSKDATAAFALLRIFVLVLISSLNMAHFLRGKQAGVQADLSTGVAPDFFVLDDVWHSQETLLV